ncbi:MAG: PD40 domain-containing protein, partial [Anaerolineaceae bacterium]|nr:PD40 domain-containing protein [Anaerolineaceae bacterium]
MKPYLRNILILVVVLLAATLIYLQFSDKQGDIQVDTVTLTENGQIGVFGPVGLQFDRPMDQASVEDRISFTPKTPGRFVWDQNTVWFFPDEPIDLMQGLSLSLRSGAKSSDGETLNLKLEWNPSIRSTELLYLVLAEDGGDLWRWSFTEQAGTALTDTGGTIIDFAPNRVGEVIAYAAENEEGGSDIWTTDRDGTTQTLIVDCGSDYCSQPAWSMDSALIAYARQGRNEGTGLLQSPKIWLYDNHTLETTPLYPERNITGELPSFSPDGQHLAFYNFSQRAIQILNLETGQETLIPTEVEEVGDWSSDGSQLLFTDLIPSALEPEAA